MLVSSKGTGDFHDLLEDLLVEEHGVTREDAALLVKTHVNIVMQGIMAAPNGNVNLMLRPTAIALRAVLAKCRQKEPR